jgi:hypothetical protein
LLVVISGWAKPMREEVQAGHRQKVLVRHRARRGPQFSPDAPG